MAIRLSAPLALDFPTFLYSRVLLFWAREGEKTPCRGKALICQEVMVRSKLKNSNKKLSDSINCFEVGYFLW
jgi:hypothetical protein